METVLCTKIIKHLGLAFTLPGTSLLVFKLPSIQKVKEEEIARK
jgi:hypothetical protein